VNDSAKNSETKGFSICFWTVIDGPFEKETRLEKTVGLGFGIIQNSLSCYWTINKCLISR
jgi:hypothetical protein